MKHEKMDLLVNELANQFSGTIGMSVKEIGENKAYSYQGEKLMATASTMKVFVLGAILEEVQKGKILLEDKVQLKREDQVGGSGVLKELDPGLVMTVKDVATLMIIKSDNTATNILMDMAGGVEKINAHMVRHGIKNSRVGSKIDFEYIGNDFRKLAIASADEFVAYLEKIYQRKILSEAMTKIFFSIMGKQQYLDQVPRYIPFNPYAADLGIDEGAGAVRVANKTGFTAGVRVDVGYLFRGSKALIYAVMLNDCKDESFAPDNEANLMAGKIGRIFYEHWLLD